MSDNVSLIGRLELHIEEIKSRPEFKWDAPHEAAISALQLAIEIIRQHQATQPAQEDVVEKVAMAICMAHNVSEYAVNQYRNKPAIWNEIRKEARAAIIAYEQHAATSAKEAV